jgi:hypothetical protein
MAELGDVAAAEKVRLLQGFRTYDEHVDVVCALEYVFTHVTDVAATVDNFERFPRIQVEGKVLTPDFTVRFKDGTGIVGEIARISLEEGSVDKLAKQILGYSKTLALPSAGGLSKPVSHVDVLQIVPLQVAPDAVGRLWKRYSDPEHFYAPAEFPCIAQYARLKDPDLYVIQRHGGDNNGRLCNESNRTPDVGKDWLPNLNLQVHRFARIKAEKPFINDPVNALYLAVILRQKVWPSRYGAEPFVKVTVSETAGWVREQYGVGRNAEVKAALELLRRAGVATLARDQKTWTVPLGRLGRERGEVQELLATRVAERIQDQGRTPLRRIGPVPHPGQASLFDAEG